MVTLTSFYPPPLTDQKDVRVRGLICLLPPHFNTTLPPLEAQCSPKSCKSFELHFPKKILPLQPHSYVILGGKFQPRLSRHTIGLFKAYWVKEESYLRNSESDKTGNSRADESRKKVFHNVIKGDMTTSASQSRRGSHIPITLFPFNYIPTTIALYFPLNISILTFIFSFRTIH